MKARIGRIVRTAHGTIGRITIGYRVLLTLEEEWQKNAPNISCIPAGNYECRRARYNRGGYDTYEITGVPNRSHILFHAGNTEEDTQGCVLLGHQLNIFDVIDEDVNRMVPKLGITNSKGAFAEFMHILGNRDSFPLVITDPVA